MTSRYLSLALTLSVFGGLLAPALAEPDSASVAPAATAVAPALTGVSASYASLQQAWDDCYNLKSTCTELLEEGRYAPSRKKWVDYYTSTIQQLVNDLQKTYTAVNSGPSDKPQWVGIGAAVTAMQPDVQKLLDSAANMKSPTDDKYPATFWEPTRSILKGANDLDKSLVDILGGMDGASGANFVTAGGGAPKLKGSVRNYGDQNNLEGLVRASQKVSTATLNMSGELDRFNMSFAKAPTQPLKDEFYQGAFTKQEILSQYKYMPSFVFTTDPSVARFTYRLPARKNMLTYYTNQIGQLLNLMDSEMLAIQATLPADQTTPTSGPWQAMQQKYVDARNQYMALFKLTQSVTDAQLAADIRGEETNFGAPVIAIRDDMDQLRSAINDFVSISK